MKTKEQVETFVEELTALTLKHGIALEVGYDVEIHFTDLSDPMGEAGSCLQWLGKDGDLSRKRAAHGTEWTPEERYDFGYAGDEG